MNKGKIVDGRRAAAEVVEDEVMSESRRRGVFHFTEDERRRIVDTLGDQGGEVDEEVINRIEVLVDLAAGAVKFLEDHPVCPRLFDKYRGLPKSIKQILGVLDNDQSRHLDELLPHLRQELRLLALMIEKDTKKGKGRRPDPKTKHWHWLVEQLADVWGKQTGKTISRSYRQDIGREDGPFPRFVHACLDPTGLNMPEWALRQAIKMIRERLGVQRDARRR